MARRAAEPLNAEYLRRHVTALIGEAASVRDRFGIAVSGGGDSVALLALAAHAFPGRVEAATVDHGLRPEAQAEANAVAVLAATLDVPHVTLRPGKRLERGDQATARAARYTLLDGWRAERGLDWVMTAHHADDQLETMLMRLARGSGVDGLSGIRARSGHLLRPLLGRRHAELTHYCAEHGLAWCEDPSNVDERHDRARFRAAIARLDGLIDPVSATRSASAAAAAAQALDWVTQELARERRKRRESTIELNVTELPDELVLRLFKSALGEPSPRGETLEAAIATLRSGRRTTLGQFIVDPIDAAGRWRLTLAPPRAAK